MEKTKTRVGKLSLDHCFMNASGVKCRTGNDLRNLYRSKVRTGAVVCKSCTLDFRRGNQGTTYYKKDDFDWSDGYEITYYDGAGKTLGRKIVDVCAGIVGCSPSPVTPGVLSGARGHC